MPSNSYTIKEFKEKLVPDFNEYVETVDITDVEYHVGIDFQHEGLAGVSANLRFKDSPHRVQTLSFDAQEFDNEIYVFKKSYNKELSKWKERSAYEKKNKAMIKKYEYLNKTE